eukprot:1081451_1
MQIKNFMSMCRFISLINTQYTNKPIIEPRLVTILSGSIHVNHHCFQHSPYAHAIHASSSAILNTPPFVNRHLPPIHQDIQEKSFAELLLRCIGWYTPGYGSSASSL